MKYRLPFVVLCVYLSVGNGYTTEYDQDILVVTGTKTEEQLRHSTNRIAVYNSEAIYRSGAISTEEYLAQLPGITVRNHGTFSVRINGEDGRYTKVLINGIPVNGDVDGSFPIELIPLHSIERIEIMRGTASTLYGSDAMAGVIHIITKKPSATEPIAGELLYQYGTNFSSSKWDSPGFSAIDKIIVSNGSERSHWRGEQTGALTVSHSNRAFSAGFTGGFTRNSGVVDTIEPKFDPINRKLAPYYSMNQSNRANGTLSLLVLPTDRQSIQGSFGMVQSSSLSSPVLSQEYTIEDSRRSGDLTYINDFNDRLSLRWWITTQNHRHESSLYDHDSKRELQDKAITFSTTESELTTSLFPKSHHISVGINGKYETVEGEELEGASRSGTEAALFVHDLWDIRESDRLILTSGVRFTYNSRYRGNISPKVGLRFNATDWLSLRANGGFGYKAPTFKNNYFIYIHAKPANFLLVGNPDLLPETSVGGNVSATISPRKELSFTVSGSYTSYRDMITNMLVSDSSGIYGGSAEFSGVREYVNLDQGVTQGLECSVHWKPAQWVQVAGSYQFVNKEATERPDSLNNLSFNPHETQGAVGYSPHELKGSSTITITRFGEFATRITPSVTWMSEQLVDQKSGATLAPYFMMNLTINQPIRPWLDASLAIKNLTDNTEQDHGLGYGRTISAAVRASLKPKSNK